MYGKNVKSKKKIRFRKYIFVREIVKNIFVICIMCLYVDKIYEIIGEKKQHVISCE